jgi:hypothetical protein
MVRPAGPWQSGQTLLSLPIGERSIGSFIGCGKPGRSSGVSGGIGADGPERLVRANQPFVAGLGPVGSRPDRQEVDSKARNRRLQLMRLHMNAADVRELVSSHFLKLGADVDDVADVQENIRIDRGKCVARCYRVAEMFAMWLIDVGVLQFYDADGEMLHTVNLFTEMMPTRAAA